MRLIHSGHIARFGYHPNQVHNSELAIRTSHHEFALRMLAAAPDDNGDRHNYRMLVACLQASHLAQWLVEDGQYTRLNSYDQYQTNACSGHGRSMQIALEDAANIVSRAQSELFQAMPAPEVQYPFGLMVDGTLGSDNGCSGSGIVEGSERYGTWYELNVKGDPDGLADGNWAGSASIPTWYRRIEQFATNGVPAAIVAAAAQHKSQAHANVTTVAQAWAAIGHAYPILICSNISFEANRNEEGVIRATGHDWPHCMVVSSRRTSPKYGRLYLVHQSWELNWTSGPYYLDQPAGSFWIVEDDLAQILVCQWNRRSVVRDCWTSTGHQGFTARADQLPVWVKNAV
ncbi:MAG: hypothetical protein ACLP9L_26135 [Thermoguttaceae bacterium]